MTDYAARIRAARAYAGIHQTTLAERLGVDVQTIKRREKGESPPRKGELVAIAEACGVPPEFMEDGFGAVEPSELLDRLERIEGAIEAGDVREAISDLRRYVETAADDLRGQVSVRSMSLASINERLGRMELHQQAIMDANARLLNLAEELLPGDDDLRARAARVAESVSRSLEEGTNGSEQSDPATDRPAQGQ